MARLDDEGAREPLYADCLFDWRQNRISIQFHLYSPTSHVRIIYMLFWGGFTRKTAAAPATKITCRMCGWGWRGGGPELCREGKASCQRPGPRPKVFPWWERSKVLSWTDSLRKGECYESYHQCPTEPPTCQRRPAVHAGTSATSPDTLKEIKQKKTLKPKGLPHHQNPNDDSGSRVVIPSCLSR